MGRRRRRRRSRIPDVPGDSGAAEELAVNALNACVDGGSGRDGRLWWQKWRWNDWPKQSWNYSRNVHLHGDRYRGPVGHTDTHNQVYLECELGFFRKFGGVIAMSAGRQRLTD